jgi:hypothetical protein
MFNCGSFRRECASHSFAKTKYRRAPAMASLLLRTTAAMAGAYESELC